MRLFAAIPVGPPVDLILGELLGRWSSSDWPVKWVRPAGLHLTLKFLGSVAPERLEEIAAALEQAIGRTPPLSFTLTELGGFPSLRKARILWAGLEAEAALELMVDRIERGFSQLGFSVEGRPYRPHVTLGRLREGSRLPEPAIETIEGITLDPVSFMSPAVVLYESLTGQGGSRYETRATFPLGTR